MMIKWLFQAETEYHDLVHYYRTKVGTQSARRFSRKILDAVALLADFPEMGVLREDLLLGKYGFRALFIDRYVCIYRIDGDMVFIYHIVDARTDYIYRIFGIEASESE